MSGRERLMTVVVSQLLHDAAATGYERRRRSRRAESGLGASLAAASQREGRSTWRPPDRGRDDVGPGRRLRAVENGPSAARLTMRRRLGVCRAPVKHRLGNGVSRPLGTNPRRRRWDPLRARLLTALSRRSDGAPARRRHARECAWFIASSPRGRESRGEAGWPGPWSEPTQCEAGTAAQRFLASCSDRVIRAADQ